MFPMQITIANPAQLNAVMAALGVADADTSAPAKQEQRTPKPQAPAAKPETASTQTTAATSAAPAQSAESSAPITFEALKTAFLKLAGANREAAVKLLGEHGCAKLTDAKPEQYVAIHADIQKASA
jgi:hypothetical protein